MYRKLNPEKTIDTIRILFNRINERFPDSGLKNVCRELITIAEESNERAVLFSQPNWIIRFVISLIVFLSLFVLFYSFSHITFSDDKFSWGYLIQTIDAGFNNIIIIGAALFSLFTFESRIKRKRALTALYELRAIAHVIDMHQLTKDPGKIIIKQIATPNSPQINLSEFELTRYLDYSSEMLSLVSKIATLYAENLRDPVVLSAVNEIENITTGLSRKIWQKIMILNLLKG